ARSPAGPQFDEPCDLADALAMGETLPPKQIQTLGPCSLLHRIKNQQWVFAVREKGVNGTSTWKRLVAREFPLGGTSKSGRKPTTRSGKGISNRVNSLRRRTSSAGRSGSFGVGRKVIA